MHQFHTRTVVFDSHDDETDVTAFWRILGVDADALPSFESDGDSVLGRTQFVQMKEVW